jgi:tetratricopeptide (TPR) repeat protein
LDLAENPDHTFIEFNLGMTHADLGEHVPAVDWLRRSIAHGQPHESHLRKAYSLLVSCLASLQRLGEAMRECDVGLRLFPLDTELRFRRALILQQMQRLPEAVAAYEDVLARAEERHFTSVVAGLSGYKARHNLALVFEEMNDWARAEQQWRQVLAEAPSFAPSWHGLATLLLKAGKLRAAEQLLAEMDGKPRLGRERALLAARLALAQGQRERARRIMEEAISQAPQDVDLLNGWAQMLFECFSPLEAEPYLWAILKLVPDDASAWCNLGTIRSLQQRPEEAARAYEDSLRYRPDSVPTHLNAAQAYWSVGNVEAAARHWNRVLELEPGHRGAAEALHLLNRR